MNLKVFISRNDCLKTNPEGAFSSKEVAASEDVDIQMIPDITHYYIAIDLRTIKLTSPNFDSCGILSRPFYLQFSYAFFGVTEPIKTYPAISFTEDNRQVAASIPHGFCGFNFATSPSKLQYSFTHIPLIVQLISEKDDTLLGTAEIDLSSLLSYHQQLETISNDLGDNFVNTTVLVHDEINEQICEIQVVMFLQEIQNHSSNKEINSKLLDFFEKLPSKDKTDNRKVSTLMNNLNDMIIETTHDIEMWKEEQVKQFKNKLKQKEKEYMASLQKNDNSADIAAKLKSLRELEDKLKASVDKINEREKILMEKEKKNDENHKELQKKLNSLNKEINNAIHEVRLQYNDKENVYKNKIKLMEEDRRKCQDRIHQLERQLKDKNNRIKELETKLSSGLPAGRQMAQRANSLSRPPSANGRKISITRDIDE